MDHINGFPSWINLILRLRKDHFLIFRCNLIFWIFFKNTQVEIGHSIYFIQAYLVISAFPRLERGHSYWFFTETQNFRLLFNVNVVRYEINQLDDIFFF